ncbi:rhodanese-like domain-containing protein [Paenibacillus sp. BSR1-1]|uniref:rhodanese-like domain-containing protein n=1 Tax=Paenibacillus sp. BSR1-1 TaxID=3020845 RepID=UPI0025B214C1|nr:rhodanese-like domain-containing protein [Paenibacillus sp. BSR1-1]MDN3017506.1 rhodanese-like domain-containing protein [Paenibacillus sp. BSR1-1]
MTIKKISPKELHESLKDNEKVLLLDVRAEEKYNEFHIEEPQIQSVNIPKTDIFAMEDTQENLHTSLPKDRKIVVTCTTGNSAAKCANILDGRGFKVIVLEGGLTAWKEYMKSLND